MMRKRQAKDFFGLAATLKQQFEAIAA